MENILNSFLGDKAEREDKLYQIYEYIEDNNKRGIVKILKTGVSLNLEYDNSTPLLKCLEYDNYELAEYFVKFGGANPNYREKNDEGPLWYSIRNQKMDFFHLFLSINPNIPRGNNHQIALIEATKLSNVLMVEGLLKNKKVKVNEKDGYGNTALHYALAKNPLTADDMDIARLLLAAGADDNSMNASGEKPGTKNDDSMANSILFENKLQKKMEAQNEAKLQAELELEAQANVSLENNNEAEIEYEEVMELDPVTNTMKPVLRPKPKPRPLPKPTPGTTKRKKI